MVEIVLVEDPEWEALRPLTWIRPAGELRIGAWTIAERWRRASRRAVRFLCRPDVDPLAGPQGPRVFDPGPERLWVRDRWIPDAASFAGIERAPGPVAFRSGGAVWGVRTAAVPDASAQVGGEAFWSGLSRNAAVEEVGEVHELRRLPDVLREHARLLPGDLEEILAETPVAAAIGEAHAYVPEALRAAAGCRIDHGAVLDAREGPVILGERTVVAPHAWIRGPFLCLEDCILLGGRIGGGSVLGPGCRVHGELDSSILLGHVNKAHDGYLGHSVLGEWVNVGALTTTSDLKNNYGGVRLSAYGREIDSGLIKLGSFMGDHVKTRIGAMLNTGSVIGLGSNVFGEDSVFPKWIPDFTWGTGRQAKVYDLGRFLATAEIVLGRRGRTLAAGTRAALRAAFENSRGERESFLSGLV